MESFVANEADYFYCLKVTVPVDPLKINVFVPILYISRFLASRVLCHA